MTTTVPMTFDQHDCYERCPGLVKTIEQLQRDLTESRKATESVQAAAEEERVALRAELTRRGDTIAEAGIRSINLMNMVRQHAAALVETLKALRGLLDALDALDAHNGRASVRQAVACPVQAAREVLRKHDVPF